MRPGIGRGATVRSRLRNVWKRGSRRGAWVTDLRLLLPPRDRPSVPLAVCAIFKDEASYLAEWVAFHRLVGVDQFYLYDNGSTDDWLDPLTPHIESGVVQVTPWRHPPRHAQLSAYRHCLRHRRGQPRWLAFIDIDEFLFSPTGRSVPEVLTELERFPGVVAAWRVYGTGGWKDRPKGLVTESYLLRAAEHHWLSAYGKPVVDPGRTLSFFDSPHCFYHCKRGRPWIQEPPVDEAGNAFTGICATADVLRINHYYAKSEVEAAAKARRGSVTHDPQHSTPLAQFLDQALNEVRDDAILQFLPDLRRRLRSGSEQAPSSRSV
jgi:hypothetical protein